MEDIVIPKPSEREGEGCCVKEGIWKRAVAAERPSLRSRQKYIPVVYRPSRTLGFTFVLYSATVLTCVHCQVSAITVPYRIVPLS